MTKETHRPTENEIVLAVEQAKSEILHDQRVGRVPDVEGFSDLHDYVDANEYGGLCADRADWSIEDAAEVQERLDVWLRSRIEEATPEGTMRLCRCGHENAEHMTEPLLTVETACTLCPCRLFEDPSPSMTEALDDAAEVLARLRKRYEIRWVVPAESTTTGRGVLGTTVVEVEDLAAATAVWESIVDVDLFHPGANVSASDRDVVSGTLLDGATLATVEDFHADEVLTDDWRAVLLGISEASS